MNHLPLQDLNFGHEIGLNARTRRRDEDLSSLARSIATNGMIAPLVVTEKDGRYYVVDGNRRLAALRLLNEAGDLPLLEIPVRVADAVGDADLLQTSLVANIERLPLHPVDQYEALVALQATGLTVGDLAARFGVLEREVRQRLALGDLAPEIRQAWADGQIDAGVARAFTLRPDHDLQVKVFKRLRKAGTLQTWAIKGAMAKDAQEMPGELAFVGVEAFEAAGGRFIPDLFEDRTLIETPDILVALVAEKLKETIDEMLAEGWKWCLNSDDAEVAGSWNWEGIEPKPKFTTEEAARLADLDAVPRSDDGYVAVAEEAAMIRHQACLRSFTDEDKARSGVILNLSRSGQIRVRVGLLRPDDSGEVEDDTDETAPPPRAEAPADPKPTIPGALVDRLRDMQTTAFAQLVSEEPQIALRLLLASLLAGRRSGSPICITAHARDPAQAPLDASIQRLGGGADPRGAAFADALEWVNGVPAGELDALFAATVASAVDVTTSARVGNYSAGVTADGVNALESSFLALRVVKALRMALDPEVYFGGAKKDHAATAIRECLGADALAKVKGKKSDFAAAAVAAVRSDSGKLWLPPELRPEIYYDPAPPPPSQEAPADEAPARVKLSKPQRENLLALGAAGACDKTSAIPQPGQTIPINISPGSVGALIRNGLADKRVFSRGGQQITGYWLTEAGQALYRQLAEKG